MARMVVLGLVFFAVILIYTAAEMRPADGEFFNADIKGREEEEADQRRTMVVVNGIIVTGVLVGLPLSVVALRQTRWGQKARRRLTRHGSLSRRKVLTPLPLATSAARGAATSRGPIGFIAAAYRNDPVGTLGWIGLVAALGILPAAIWLSMLRL